MDGEGIGLEESLNMLKELLDADKVKAADTMANDLAEELKGRGKALDASRVYEVLAGGLPSNQETKRNFLKKLMGLFERDLTQQIFVKNAGFDDPNRRVKLNDCFARLNLLRALVPGAMCFNKTWSFGIVKELLLSDNKVCIDFTKRQGHHLALNYAATSLELVGEDHLLARRHLDPEGFEKLVKKQPGEVIKMALQSFGARPIVILQEFLSPEVVEETRWKRFWDAARKQLKEDPCVIIPSKRSDSIELLEQEKSYDDAWFNELQKNTDMDSILALVEEVFGKKVPDSISEQSRVSLANRLGFVVKGAEGRLHGKMVHALLLSKKAGFSPQEIDADDFVERLYEPAHFLEVLDALTVKETKGFLDYLLEQKESESIDLFLGSVPELEISSLGEVLDQLLGRGKEAEVAEVFRSHWNTWSLSVAGLCWLNNHFEKVETWGLGAITDVALRNLSELQKDYMGEKLRARNQLRDKFSQPAWIKTVMAAMDDRQRRTLTQGIKNSTGWAKLDKASVLGKIVKMYPEMQEVISDQLREESKISTTGPITSFRSYHEREAQLKKLIQEDIPKNSKEIAAAREFGDLRENFEYKSAKDQQRLLLQRQADFEEMLRHVTPTNFEGFPTEKAGLATQVTLQFDDGRVESWSILGEWDGNEDLCIISSGSRLAKMLQGKAAGERVYVPSEAGGEVECLLASVEALPDAVKDWLGTNKEDE